MNILNTRQLKYHYNSFSELYIISLSSFTSLEFNAKYNIPKIY